MYRTTILLFGGGCDIMDDRFSDLYIFDTETLKWSRINYSGQV